MEMSDCKKIENRKRMVLAMEMIARAVNDEEVFESWLMYGVPDGEITRYSIDTNEVDEYFTEDEHYRELMDLFLMVMKNAYKSGGLYDSDVVTVTGVKEE